MPIKIEISVKAAVSVAGMCRLLKMSRSQFYFHVKRGTFHTPHYLPSNKRPYFTAAMAEDNLRARESGIGVNNEYVIFYERLPAGIKCEAKTSKTDISALLEGLKRTPAKDVPRAQVEQALADCFPTGTSGKDEEHVLKAVYRHLKDQLSG